MPRAGLYPCSALRPGAVCEWGKRAIFDACSCQRSGWQRCHTPQHYASLARLGIIAHRPERHRRTSEYHPRVTR